MTPEERRMLADWATQLLSSGRGEALVTELAESGMGAEVWSDPAAAGAVFEAHGAVCATSGLLDAYVLRPDGTGRTPRIVLPAPGSSAPPSRVAGTDITVDGVTIGAGGADLVLGTDSGDLLLARGLSEVPVTGFDPDLGLIRVRGVVTLDDCTSLAIPVGWDVLVARAARVVAHELVGVAAAAREIATRHVQERMQFGRPIGTFQTVRHRLADGLIAETGARELLDAGEPTDSVAEVLLRKAAAGRAALLAVQAAQQVCGAMGFTAEFGLHRYVRRAYVLDSLLGGSEDAEFELGSAALATGRIPVAAGV